MDTLHDLRRDLAGVDGPGPLFCQSLECVSVGGILEGVAFPQRSSVGTREQRVHLGGRLERKLR